MDEIRWTWGSSPHEEGWYATIHSWDAATEGSFPGAHYWDGKHWGENLPIYSWSNQPFESKKAAEDWADANDPEAPRG